MSVLWEGAITMDTMPIETQPCDECDGEGIDCIIFEDGLSPEVILCDVCGGTGLLDTQLEKLDG